LHQKNLLVPWRIEKVKGCTREREGEGRYPKGRGKGENAVTDCTVEKVS